MSVLGLTHLEIQTRRRHTADAPCSGRMLIVDQFEPVWTIVCDECGFEAGLPAREASPAVRQRMQAQQVEQWRQTSGIPTALRGLTWDDVGGHPPAVLAAAVAFAAGETSGVLLTGAVGVGKTWLAAVAAWARIEHGQVRWFSTPTLFARLGLSFADDARDEAVEALIGLTGLVLDDLDKCRPSEYAAEQLFCAIDNRVTAGAPLLVTTNLGLGAIAEKFPAPYGEAIASRLAGHCAAFALEGRDRRLDRLAA